MMIFIAGLFGFFVGSFLNVLVDRLPRGESVLFGRSHCESCKKTLRWYDLFPVVSFLSLNGKCRYCHKKLSVYYPVIEIITALLFMLTVFTVEQSSTYHVASSMYWATMFYYVSIVCVLLVVFFTDLKYGIIPFAVVIPAIIISFIFGIVNYQLSFINLFFSGVGAALFFLSLFLATKGKGMGFGDVVFALLMGIVLGFPRIVVAIYLAFLTGAILSLILILWGKKKLAGGTIPFGPFLVFSTYICMFWGNLLVDVLRKILNI